MCRRCGHSAHDERSTSVPQSVEHVPGPRGTGCPSRENCTLCPPGIHTRNSYRVVICEQKLPNPAHMRQVGRMRWASLRQYGLLEQSVSSYVAPRCARGPWAGSLSVAAVCVSVDAPPSAVRVRVDIQSTGDTVKKEVEKTVVRCRYGAFGPGIGTVESGTVVRCRCDAFGSGISRVVIRLQFTQICEHPYRPNATLS